MSDALPIKVAIVEDDERVRSSLEVLINGATGFTCTGAYPSAETAIEHIPANPPDVVLMDIHLPKATGIDCVKAIRSKCPAVNILMLTVNEDEDTIFQALRAGASGYLLKGTEMAELLACIKNVHEGGAPMSSTIARKVIQAFRAEPDTEETPQLSRRETEILHLVAQGMSDKDIANELHIESDTVHTHIRRIYTKLHVKSRTQAVAKYFAPKGFMRLFKKLRDAS